MDAPDGTNASNAQGMTIALAILARDLQSKFGNPGCHVLISNEHSGNGSSHSSLLTIVRGNSDAEITQWTNYKLLQLGLLPKNTGGTGIMSNLNSTTHLRYHYSARQIHEMFKYHNKVPTAIHKKTNKKTLRAHHINMDLPTMAGNTVVLFTGNQHPFMRHQVFRRYLPSFDRTTLSYGPRYPQCEYFNPLPVGHSTIMARIEPNQRDWQQVRRQERAARDEEIIARERRSVGGVESLIRRFPNMNLRSLVRTGPRPSTRP